MSVRPTREERECGRRNEWSAHAVRTGYQIFDYDGTGMLEVEEIDDMETFSRYIKENDLDMSPNELAALQAMEDGYCKIIPVDELPENFDMRCFGWVDTPENRLAIQKYCEED